MEFQKFTSPFYPLSRAIKKEIGEGMNYFLLVNGRPQTFKSLLSITIANNEDKYYLEDFLDKPNSRMSVGRAKDFMHILNNAPPRRGTCVQFDEVGVGVAAREYMKFINRSISKVVQTFGHEGKLIIYTTPAMKFFDPHLRTMVNGYIETLRPDKRNGYAMVKYFDLSYNPMEDKVYRHSRRVRSVIKMKVTMLRIKIPPQPIIKHYMGYSQPIKIGLREDIEMDMTKMDSKADTPKTDWEGMINEAIDKKYLVTIHALRARFDTLSDGKARILRNKIIDECKIRGIKANIFEPIKKPVVKAPSGAYPSPQLTDERMKKHYY